MGIDEILEMMNDQDVIDRSALFISDPVNGDQLLVTDDRPPIPTTAEGSERATVRHFLNTLDFGCYRDGDLIFQVYPKRS